MVKETPRDTNNDTEVDFTPEVLCANSSESLIVPDKDSERYLVEQPDSEISREDAQQSVHVCKPEDCVLSAVFC
jgi:hypothetical protein